jgi:hypothetical protein
MSIEKLIISKDEAEKLRPLFKKCIICGVTYNSQNKCSQDNSHWFYNPICRNTKCKKIWYYLGSDMQYRIKYFFSGLEDALRYYYNNFYYDDPDKMHFDVDGYSIDNMSSFLFKNNSIGSDSTETINIGTDDRMYSFGEKGSIVVNNNIFHEWIEFLNKNDSYFYMYENTKHWSETITRAVFSSRYFPPMDLLKRIDELKQEFELTQKLIKQINKTEIKFSGFCKTVKYKQINYFNYEKHKSKTFAL